jgi:hypothetical protein
MLVDERFGGVGGGGLRLGWYVRRVTHDEERPGSQETMYSLFYAAFFTEMMKVRGKEGMK